MPHDYNVITKEIIDNAGIANGDIFYFDDVPLHAVFNLYFQFCQENLNRASKTFNISPARFYVRNDISVNASASLRNNYFLIAVNSGTLVNLYYFFEKKADLFESGKLSFLSELNKALTETKDAPLYYLMQQACNQFTYYHELGHLIQKSGELSHVIEERYFDVEPAFSFERHVYEFDADIYGAEHIAFHLLEFWKKQEAPIKTEENLSYLISIGASAIFSYFLKLMEGYNDIYYGEHSHPHPLVRILYITDCFIRTVEGHVKINAHEILQNSFTILDEIFKSDGSGIVGQFVELFRQEQNNIKSYVDNHIISHVSNMPELAYNKLRTDTSSIF